MYLRIVNNDITFPYELRYLSRDFPNVSFPRTLSDGLLEGYGIYRVSPTTKPTYDYTKNITMGIPQNVDGGWVQIWDVTDASSEELDERISDKWIEVRDDRNRLLSESDWTQLSDAPVTDLQAWRDYRQSLRDVTLQQNPFQIQWPDKP